MNRTKSPQITSRMVKFFSKNMEFLPTYNRLALPSNSSSPNTSNTNDENSSFNSHPKREYLDEVSNRNPIRYNVCKENSYPLKKFAFEKRCAIKETRSPIPEPQSEKQHADDNVPHNPTSSVAKGYRPFEVSTTQKTVVLPLKYSKLSSPFPDPVKVMPSQTISDMEKADQAQAEFRVPRSIMRKRRV